MRLGLAVPEEDAYGASPLLVEEGRLEPFALFCRVDRQQQVRPGRQPSQLETARLIRPGRHDLSGKWVPERRVIRERKNRVLDERRATHAVDEREHPVTGGEGQVVEDRGEIGDLETRKSTSLDLPDDPQQVLGWSADDKWLLSAKCSIRMRYGNVTYYRNDLYRFDWEAKTTKALCDSLQVHNCVVSPDGLTLFGVGHKHDDKQTPMR